MMAAMGEAASALKSRRRRPARFGQRQPVRGSFRLGFSAFLNTLFAAKSAQKKIPRRAQSRCIVTDSSTTDVHSKGSILESPTTSQPFPPHTHTPLHAKASVHKSEINTFTYMETYEKQSRILYKMQLVLPRPCFTTDRQSSAFLNRL
jgi:hypothetical protein